ncbi:DUF1194 domain-containing protein [Acetobacteraceae bacterium H6797]|nr:DUF1194 domain-containing protein [Acetobacteraceae bacterium H6797]
MRRRTLLALPSLLLPAAARAQARPAVDTLLVLAMDASGSITPDEFALQRDGMAEAITAPAVLSTIAAKPNGAIAVAVVEWGAPGGAMTVVNWHRIDGAASANIAAEAMRNAPRSLQSWNAIGDGITHATRLIAEAPFTSEDRVIDVAGDAPDMRSETPAAVARDAAVAAGITVNGLAILSGYGRDEAFQARLREEVLGGPGAFLMTADSRMDFARALRAKLVREIAGMGGRQFA